MNVLIINDEKWTADMIREDVDWEKCGIHKVFTAYDAASAREQIKRGDIQIEMPGENGIQLMHWVPSMNMKLNVFSLPVMLIFLMHRKL